MKKTLKYIFSCILFICMLFSAHGQEKRIRGIRIGYNVSSLAFYLQETERSQMEFSIDLEVKKDIYPVIEYGVDNIFISKPEYDYESEGYYFRFGVEKNFLKKLKVNQYEMLFGGIRYGFSNFTQSASNVVVPDAYWGDFEDGFIAPKGINAHWAEFSGGIRGEIFKNFFIGWSFRYRLLIAQSAEDTMDPYLIPGFGIYKGNRSNIGFTYSIYYRIPLYRVSYGE